MPTSRTGSDTTRRARSARRPTARALPPPAADPDGSDPSADRTALPRLDGRRAHVLDRAADYLRLAEQGHTAAQIARRRRKSPAHVSILLRLGRALADLPEDERAALRHPRITWRLVQRLVRTDTDPPSLRRQLRAALGGFSSHNVDGRRQRRARTAILADTAADAAISPPGSVARGVAPGVAWGWDASWFARDPAGYAAAHLAHLVHLHHVVQTRAEQAVRARATAALAGLDAGQSLRGLQRRLAQRPEPSHPNITPAERDALAALAELGRALGAVAAREATGGDGAPSPPVT